MRLEGKRFGIPTSKTLRKNGNRAQESKLSNLDPTSEAIIDGIKERHSAKVRAAQPISPSEERKHQKLQKNELKKRALKSRKSEEEEEIVSDEDEFIPYSLPMSTYDQVLKNATSEE